ncbi:putative RNA polymerase II subunit B1 CTD phosphatase RPAP2 homolog isoform X1 [Dendrobium catenatum]|uniref:RNA polymerase II subunit B1 CTD phosphatase RPAP2 homolog n=1 Tax=Dendrobium catenatum TaxID=906689 RepID=A0A2I0X500_9ASPA|nr:putative RNA polymerase II subunit B1 CTD phosphatase RPAP2 homolog isoform X1 [Dendrobium catenatum]PKU82998.1 Putative RNA polymerase II subunit B1 CTD phosphatase RPAP2 like [Dendrobium catenatum]
MAADTLPRPMKIAEATYHIQLFLIECPSCSTEQLLTAGYLLSRPDYQDIVVERSIVGFCGYPLCHNRLPSVDRNRHARFKVSLRDQRIYNLEETYKYCSEACQVRSMAFSKSLSTERACDLNQARIEQALRLFGNLDVGGEEFEDEGDVGIKSLSIKEKGVAGAGEVSLNEWIGPANAIEGYVPQRDRITDSGLNIIPQQHFGKKIEGARDSRAPFASSSLLVGNESNEIHLKESSNVKLPRAKKRDANNADKKKKSKKTASKTSKLKLKKNPDDYGHGNMDFTSSVIVGTGFDDHNALSLTGQDISEVIAKQLENVVLEEKKIEKKVGISKPSRFKDHKKLEDATNEKVLSKEINGVLVDVCFGEESDKTAVNISNYEEFSEKKASSNETMVMELEDKISSAKKEISKEKLLKSCLKNSGSRVGDHYVKWADEKRNASFEDKMTIPQESSEELFDSSVRIASAEVCAVALTQAAESVVSGKAEVGDAVLEAGILILPQLQCLEGERVDDENIFKFDQGIVKWPKKTVLLDTNMFEVEDSWHDTPPEGFSLNLSPFATMWMALFGWITCSSLAYIYGHDESSYENFMLINGKEYPRKVIMSDGKSLEIRQILDGFICRTLSVVVKDLSLPVSVSTLEKFMGCLLNTMSFMDAIPSFKIRQWQVIVLLFIEALSVHRLLVLAPHLMSRGTQLEQMLNPAQISYEEYESMRDLILPLGRSTEFSI